MKHRVLESLGSLGQYHNQWISKTLVYDTLTKNKPFLWKLGNFNLVVTNLEKEGYICRIVESEGDKIFFTDKGIAALTDCKFLNDNKRIVLTNLKDYLLIGCNIVIAIATIYALNRNIDDNKIEFKKIQLTVDSLSNKITVIENKWDSLYLGKSPFVPVKQKPR